MTPARRSRILLSFGMALAAGAPAPLCAASAHAIDNELLSLPGRDSTQPLAARLQTHDQAELLMVLDELHPGTDATDSNGRAVADFLRAGQPDVVADHALDALARLKSREAHSVLVVFSRHRRPEARVRAYTALANLRELRDIPLIMGGLRDSAPQVRSQAATLLGQLHAVEAVADLLRALELGVHQAAAAIGKLGDAASVQAFGKQLGKLPLPVMLDGYAQYLDRPDIPEATKLEIIAALEDVSGASVKAFLNARVQNPSKHSSPKLQQAMAVSAGRIRVEPAAADTSQPAAPRRAPPSGTNPELQP